MVGLEFVLPGLVGVPQLVCVGQALFWLHTLESICAVGDAAVVHREYVSRVWGPLFGHDPRYAGMSAALQDLSTLVAAVPQDWRAAAMTVVVGLAAASLVARQAICLPVTAALVAQARTRVCSDLGWRTRGGVVVRVASLTVALATQLQTLDSHIAIADRHSAFVDRVQALDQAHPGGPHLPPVTRVLARWWRLKVPNTYKEPAWRLTLNAFPAAERMHAGTASDCVSCGAPRPGVSHHFWSCSVAVAVRREVEAQLRAFNLLQAGQSLRCVNVWMGVKPAPQLHGMVWDMVCLAAIHAIDLGRRAAWVTSQRLEVPALVDDVVRRVARAGFWDVLTDLAVSVVVPDRARTASLLQQPFVTWCLLLARGNGMRVVRR